MTKHISTNKAQIALLFFLTCIAVYIYIYVQPTNLVLIGGFAMLLALITFLSTSLFFSKKIAILSALFVGLFLGMNVFIGFQILNTILLLSGIMGIAILTKKK